MSKVVPFFRENATNGWMSNWYRSPFRMYGRDLPCQPVIDYPKKDAVLTFCNVEQFMMFCKAVCFKDFNTATKVLRTSTPNEVKALGRKVRNYDDTVWSQIRYNVVLCGIYYKINQNPNIKDMLLQFPVDTVFAEASPWDRIWGVGLPVNNNGVYNPNQWKGTNLLGRAWSEVRRSLG